MNFSHLRGTKKLNNEYTHSEIIKANESLNVTKVREITAKQHLNNLISKYELLNHEVGLIVSTKLIEKQNKYSYFSPNKRVKPKEKKITLEMMKEAKIDIIKSLDEIINALTNLNHTEETRKKAEQNMKITQDTKRNIIY